MALLGTYKLTANTQQFSEDRHMHESLLQEGVVGSGDYKVTPGGASLQWSVAAGVAWVQGDTTARQGLYPQVNDAAVTGTVAAGHATLPRIDQVILQIADSSVTGASNTPTLSTLAGTATSGATLDNRTGAAALPASALRLADVLVLAAHSGVLVANTHIRDRRPWATGAYRRIVRSTADYTGTGTAFGMMDATNLQPRIECSGVPLRCTLRARVSNSVADSLTIVSLFVDTALPAEMGAAGDIFLFNNVAANDTGLIVATWDLLPTAGSHLVGPVWRVSAGTGSIHANASNPLQFTVEELVRRANASND